MRVLVIDDEPDFLGVMSARLSRTGYDVRTAENGEEGLARMGDLRPDLILLDILMPGINGFEFCRRLRRDPRFKSIPVIIVTALIQPGHDMAKVCSRIGAQDYIAKPFATDRLMGSIHEHAPFSN